MSGTLSSLRRPVTLLFWAVVILAIGLRPDPALGGYVQTNLVSDGAVTAVHTDANLKNPWGISLSGGSPFWVSDAKTGVSTLYSVTATNNGTPISLVVTIPGGSPTGQIFNSDSTASDFVLNDSTKASFMFATLNGTIAGWNGGEGKTAQQAASVAGASFTGLAQGSNASGTFLYAANLNGGINVFDKNFKPVTLSGTFTDPNLPSGFVPYNIQDLKGTLYVTYVNFSKGGGVVDTYDTTGNFLARVATNGTLNTPWGVALAPSTFGFFANDLLVGNLTDGRINAYDPSNNYAFLGQLTLVDGTVFSEPGLWGLTFGNGGNGGLTNTLYFAAGINNQQDGLLGSLSVPEPSSWLLGLIALGMGGGAHWMRRTYPRVPQAKARP